MKASFLFGTLILTAAALTAGALPMLSTSAQEPANPAPAPFLTAAVECEYFDGTLQLFAGASDGATHAVVVDEDDDVHETYGFGISGETLIIAPDVFTRGIELGTPRDEAVPAGTLECLISQVQATQRSLTQEDIDAWSLDPSLRGAFAEIETSLTGIVWVAP